MLWRKLEDKIRKWVKEERNALLVTGARQVGKTFLIRHVLKEEKISYVEFNLIRQPEVISILNSVSKGDISLFMERLSLVSEKPLEKGKTIIFFDEIQQCKEIVTAIKFLVEDASYKYVLSGSLLGVELSDITSAPVGYLNTLKMYPLDLEEFLIALGIPRITIENLRKLYENRKPVDEVVHRRLMSAFYNYLAVGGMPEALQNYLDNKNYQYVMDIHKNIAQQYRIDCSKYEVERKLKLINAYDLIPAELNSKNKRFVFSDLNKNLKFERYEDSFSWLVNAAVALPVYNSTEPVVPLEINKKSSLFKLFHSDVGMLTTEYGSSTKLRILNEGKDLNCGAVFENVIAQELNAHGFDIYYYNNKKLGELDFVIEYKGKCLPIEVKSGKDYVRHVALDNVLKNENFHIPQAYVLSDCNVRVDEKIIYLPIYMIMFIEADEFIPISKDYDLSDLYI